MSSKNKEGVCKETVYNRVFNAHSKNLFNFLYYKYGSLYNPEDKVQEAFVKLWENCSKVPEAKAKSYLFTIANNLTLNAYAHQKVVLKFRQTKPQSYTNESPEFVLEEQEYNARLQAAIANLSEAQRSAFLLNRIEGKKHKEIAEMLGISKKAVEKRIYGALAKLKKKLQNLSRTFLTHTVIYTGNTMEREQLISKWLDNELSEAELQAFKSLEDYDDLVRIAETTKQLEPPVYHTPGEYKRLRKTLDTDKKSVIIHLKPLLKIAAVLILFAGIYYATTSTQKTVNLQTDIAQKEVITLPDNSIVTVNAMTNLYYDPTTWDDNRAVTLDGEAYFQVAKGATFSVETPNGLVSVLGTQFNVRNRDDKFEVYCYEGSVQVETATKTVILKPGDRFRESVKISSNTPQSTTLQPSWVSDETSFEKTPLKEVLKEFERHYDVSVTVDKDVEDVLFTGSFTHTNMKIALKSISLPFNLSHKKLGNKVTLSRD